MVGLLDLPSELLFNIIDLVLSLPTMQPNGKRYRPNFWKTSLRKLYCIPSLDHSQNRGAMTLLLLNQRMYVETTEYLLKAPRNFTIDVAVVNDHWLWPTRRIVPARKLDGIIERLDIHIFPCCTEGQRHLQTDWDDDRGQTHFEFSQENVFAELVFAPLICFLFYPAMESSMDKQISKLFQGLDVWVDPRSYAHPTDQSDDGRDLPVTKINTVAIYVDTWRYGNGNETLSLAEVPSRKIEGLAHLDFDQLFPVDPAKSEHYLRGLSSYIDNWTCAWRTERVGERIGKIQFYLNEELWKELNFTRRATDT